MKKFYFLIKKNKKYTYCKIVESINIGKAIHKVINEIPNNEKIDDCWMLKYE